jgi:hypothetical protein
MLAPANNRFAESLSPHSMGLRNDMTIPNPGFDSMANLANDKLWSGASPQGGMGGLTFDGSGLLGTGLFSGDISTWGISELLASFIGAYAVYSMFFQVGQTKVRLQGSAQRRRVKRAKRLREKAKKLEAQQFGSIF